MLYVGVGIYIQYARNSHVLGAQPSNSFATVTDSYYSSTRVDLYCCSNSTSASGASITVPHGSTYTSNFWHGQIYHSYSSSSYPGCIRLRYYDYRSHFHLSSSYDGIHTCNIPDSQGHILHENIGLYDEGFSSKSKYS